MKASSLIKTPPLSDPGSVVQRTRVIEHIYALLTRPNTSALLMTGLSGSGKTTLAALVFHYVEQLRLCGNGIFSSQSLWLEMGETTTLVEIVADLCDCLHIILPNSRNLAPAIRAQKLLRQLDKLEHPRLIIFDQFERLLDVQTGQARNSQDDLKTLFQLLAHRCCRCRLLFVSSFAPRGMGAYPPLHLQEFDVPPLETHEGVAILRLWGIQRQRDDLEQAVNYCQGHAQAIVCLYTVLKQDSNISLSSLSHEGQWLGDAARTFVEYCYQHQLSPEQKLLLRSFSIYRQPIAQKTVLEMLKSEERASDKPIPAPTQWQGVINLLLSLKLLTARPAQCYVVPSVVREAIHIYVQQEHEQTSRQAHIYAADYYIRRARDKEHSSTKPYQKVDDINELLEAIWHLYQAQLYKRAYTLLQERQIYKLLRKWGEAAKLREIYQPLLDWQEGATAAIYNEVGEIAIMQEQLGEAQKYFMQALLLCAGKPSGELRVVILSNLGAAYRKQGQLEEAQNQYEQALHICEEETITAEAQGVFFNNLGFLIYTRKKAENAQNVEEYDNAEDAQNIEEYDLAITYYQRALLLYQQPYNPEESVRTLNNLGDIYNICQQVAEARDYYERALKLAQHIGARRSEAIALGNLGKLYSNEANTEQAQVYYEKALRIFHQIGNSSEEATLLMSLGDLFILKEQHEVALACILQARDIFTILDYPECGQIPYWIETELHLMQDEKNMNYEDWVQSVEQRAFLLLEPLYGTKQTQTAPTLALGPVSDGINTQHKKEPSIEEEHEKKTMRTQRELQKELVTLILTIPGIEEFGMRTSLLIGIPNRLSLTRSHTNAYTDISQLVDQLTGMHLQNRQNALLIFIDNALPHFVGTQTGIQLEELCQQAGLSVWQQGSHMSPLTPVQPTTNFSTKGKIVRRKALTAAFTLAELALLCSDIRQALYRDGIDEPFSLDVLEGSTLQNKAQSLIDYCERRDWSHYLVTAIHRIRPDFNFEDETE